MADRVGKPGRGHANVLRRACRAVCQVLSALLVVPLSGGAGVGATAAAQESFVHDFSDVTTRAAARELVREGRLVEIRLVPSELGGPDDRANRSYTTPEAADARAMVIGSLRRFLEEGLIDHLEVIPDYKGDSVVPSRITMITAHSEHEGSSTVTIEVW